MYNPVYGVSVRMAECMANVQCDWPALWAAAILPICIDIPPVYGQLISNADSIGTWLPVGACEYAELPTNVEVVKLVATSRVLSRNWVQIPAIKLHLLKVQKSNALPMISGLSVTERDHKLRSTDLAGSNPAFHTNTHQFKGAGQRNQTINNRPSSMLFCDAV